MEIGLWGEVRRGAKKYFLFSLPICYTSIHGLSKFLKMRIVFMELLIFWLWTSWTLMQWYGKLKNRSLYAKICSMYTKCVGREGRQKAELICGLWCLASAPRYARLPISGVLYHVAYVYQLPKQNLLEFWLCLEAFVNIRFEPITVKGTLILLRVTQLSLTHYMI